MHFKFITNKVTKQIKNLHTWEAAHRIYVMTYTTQYKYVGIHVEVFGENLNKAMVK
jgi:hypothetical protein